MIRFTKDFPDKLRSQISISEVVGKKVSLKQKGSEFSGLCPFHNEKTPSFTVSEQKSFYHCFGCGAHGDIITFIKDTEGIDFKEAIMQLATDYNVPIPLIKNYNSELEDEKESKINRQYDLLLEAANFFNKNLLSYDSKNALEYLKKRGLNDKITQKFKIGFAPNSYNSLNSYLLKLGYKEQEFLESGIISKSQNGKIYDKFRNRIIFPIFAKNDKIIAFGGRVLDDSMPKYLNSSETLLFKKGENLYNYSKARKSIYKSSFAIIVEGYMDVIALDNAGINNVVAPLGTAITKEQILELFKITDNITFCLDGDLAGSNAMNRAINIALPLLNSNKMVKFVNLPLGQDPDDFIKNNNINIFKNLLENANSLSQSLFDFESKDIGINDFKQKILPEKKAALEANLMKRINLIQDNNSKKYFIQFYHSLLFEMGRKKSSLSSKNNPIKVYKTTIKDDSNHEYIYAKNILKLLIEDPKLIDYKDDYYKIRSFHFEDESLSNIKESFIEFFEKKKSNKNYDYEPTELLNHLVEFSLDKEIKDIILKFSQNSKDNKDRLAILILKYHHLQVLKQYNQTLLTVDTILTGNSGIIDGRQKELFGHKTELEQKILELENNLT